MHNHPETQNGDLFGNSVFADVISYFTMCSYWIRVDPKCHGWCVIRRPYEDTETQTRRGMRPGEGRGKAWNDEAIR